MSQDCTHVGSPHKDLSAVLHSLAARAARIACYGRPSESAERSKRPMYQAEFKRGDGRAFNTAASNRSTRAFRGQWSWVLATLALFLAAPASADAPCSGGDNEVAGPIATTLQPYASTFNPAGRFEVTLRSSADLTSEIGVQHVLGSKVLFRTVTKLQADLESVTVQGLPAREGLGFAIRVAQGGSGYGEICSYGFRYQSGAVFYRTLAAKGEDRRSRKTFPGAVTEWKSALNAPRR